MQQKDATEGVPAGPEFTPRRGRVTFAASAGASEQADAAAPGTAAAVHDNSKQRHVHIASDASSTEVFESGGAQHDGVAAPGTTPAAGFLNRFRVSMHTGSSQIKQPKGVASTTGCMLVAAVHAVELCLSGAATAELILIAAPA